MSKYNIITVCMGILSGLVGITGGCDSYTEYSSIIVGITSSLIYLLGKKLLVKLKIDDPIDAVSLHLGCGMWGVICVGLL